MLCAHHLGDNEVHQKTTGKFKNTRASSPSIKDCERRKLLESSLFPPPRVNNAAPAWEVEPKKEQLENDELAAAWPNNAYQGSRDREFRWAGVTRAAPHARRGTLCIRMCGRGPWTWLNRPECPLGCGTKRRRRRFRCPCATKHETGTTELSVADEEAGGSQFGPMNTSSKSAPKDDGPSRSQTWFQRDTVCTCGEPKQRRASQAR